MRHSGEVRFFNLGVGYMSRNTLLIESGRQMPSVTLMGAARNKHLAAKGLLIGSGI